MTRQVFKPEQAAGRKPLLLWPGLMLNLLLPGSGFSYLGRPWRHLAALLLTLLSWLSAWLLTLFVAYARMSSSSSLPAALAFGLVALAALLVVCPYGLLARSYLAQSRRRDVNPARRWWVPVGLHALLLALSIWRAIVKLNPPY